MLKTVAWLASIGLLGFPAEIFNFDTAIPGKMPPGWFATMTDSGAPPRWQVVKDPTARSQPYVFAQVSADKSEKRSPLAILNRTPFQNGEISVRLKPISGTEDQAGGVVWRYRDENDYYLVRANALENNIGVYRVQKGRLIPLAAKGGARGSQGVKHNVPLNQWSVLKVVFKGPQFSVYFNHRRLLQVVDGAYTGAGKVGLWTKADSVTYFDDFRVVQK